MTGGRGDAGDSSGGAQLFSRQATAYAAYRPDYPAELFAYLAGLVRRHELAWDCATGNGQAASGLAGHFARVEATDASAEQLARAVPLPNVTYRVARAERSGIEAGSVDLVTVAQALHWLDVDAFYAEARRVLSPGGAIAVWSYGSATLDEPAVQAIFSRFEHETMGPYWPRGREHVLDAYRSLPFPFSELAPPTFALERRWTLAELAGYTRSWSATARYVEAHRTDPVLALERALSEAWGDPARPRTVRWPLALRVGLASPPR